MNNELSALENSAIYRIITDNKSMGNMIAATKKLWKIKYEIMEETTENNSMVNTRFALYFASHFWCNK